MTLENMVDQIYELSVGGYFNGEKVSKGWLHNYIRTMTQEPEKLAIPGQLVMQIALPDGWWLFSIERRDDGEWDYWIPDNRDQEAGLNRKLGRLAGQVTG